MHLLFLNKIFAGNIVQAFCWMLVHSLWQGLVFTIITGLVMMATKKSSARVRYNAVSALFFLFILVCAFTFIKELTTSHAANALQNLAAGAVAGVTGLQAAVKIFSGYFSANASLIVLGWFIIFSAKCVRMAGSLVYGQRVKHHKIHQPAAYWKDKITGLATSLHITRTVQLLESEIVKLPVVIGHLKPIIFIPLGLLNSLPAGEVEAVLLHELAHIRRNDYFVNFVQVVAENIFFFNPALLWMSALLREERENCCDDVALAQTNSKKQFIQALISFKEHALHSNSYTTAFPAKKNQLLQRVSRIVHNKNKTLNNAEKAFLFGSFVLLTLLAFSMSGGQYTAPDTQKATKVNAFRHDTAAQILPMTAQTGVGANGAKNNNQKIEEADQHAMVAKQGIAEVKENKTETMQARQKVIVTDNNAPGKDEQKVTKSDEETLTDAQQAELDRQEAKKDQAQAELDRKQAEEDRKQAIADQEQAKKDMVQAELDRKQADLDRIQAMRDQQEAMKSQADAMKDKAAAAHQPKKH